MADCFNLQILLWRNRIMNKQIIGSFAAFLCVTCFLFSSCKSRTTIISTKPNSSIMTSHSAKTDECIMKDEICTEALDFQKEYNRMPDDKKEEMISILNTYITHCEESTKACRKSMKK